jgi:hypothetical protein
MTTEGMMLPIDEIFENSWELKEIDLTEDYSQFFSSREIVQL